MISKLTTSNSQAILTVVNDAAIAYKDKIPSDRWKEPYMSAQEFKEEIEGGVQFYGLKDNNVSVAVMGIQPVNDVTLIRHACVLTSYQRKGHGGKLKHLLALAETSTVYVGTWEAANWAIKFYQKTDSNWFQQRKRINS